jgi:hypothetical protein
MSVHYLTLRRGAIAVMIDFRPEILLLPSHSLHLVLIFKPSNSSLLFLDKNRLHQGDKQATD